MALDLRFSRVRTGVAAMRQDCNYYHLDTTNLGRKKGVKKRLMKLVLVVECSSHTTAGQKALMATQGLS
jgi:hypothetical protein